MWFLCNYKFLLLMDSTNRHQILFQPMLILWVGVLCCCIIKFFEGAISGWIFCLVNSNFVITIFCSFGNYPFIFCSNVVLFSLAVLRWLIAQPERASTC